jgi:uncharacterized protein (DUF952 family)
MIYHVTTAAGWKEAEAKGYYEAASLTTEGFIHASKHNQVAGVLVRYYAGKKDLLLLHIEEDKLTSKLLYELSTSVNEEFPHIYGTINLDAVVKVEEL